MGRGRYAVGSSTLLALVGFGCAALVTVFFLVRFFAGSKSSKRRSRHGRVSGFEQRHNGDSYVNLFALFNAAAVEEAAAKKAEEQEALQKKAHAKQARASLVAGVSQRFSKGIKSGVEAVKAKMLRTLSPAQQPAQPATPFAAKPTSKAPSSTPAKVLMVEDSDARFG